MRGLSVMKAKHKWLLITIVVILIVGTSIGLLLKTHYDHEHRQQQNREKVQINNKNVKVLQNISYGQGIPNSKLDIIMPSDMNKDSKLPVIFWMHGGGFIAGDKQYKNPLLSKIAEQGYIVVNVNYALAPQYKYPTPIEQMNKAVKFIKTNEHDLPIDFDQVIIGGDSAGAQLTSQYVAMQTNQSLRDEMKFEPEFKPSQIKAAIFFGGFYDMKTVKSTEFPRIQLFMRSYTGTTNWESNFKNLSQMSTINQVTKDYPPTFLSVGDADPFYSQNIDFYKKLKEKDVPAETLFYDGSHHLHHQYQFHLNKPESKENIKRVLLFLSRNTSSSGVERNNQSNNNENNNMNQDVQLDPFSE